MKRLLTLRAYLAARESSDVARSNSNRRQARRFDDAGASLILALMYIVAISLVVVALANWVTNDLRNTTTFNDAAQYDSALRSVAELGIQNIRYTPLISQTSPGPGECWTPSSGSESAQNLNGYSVAVWCSTAQNLASSATRVVTLYVCPITVTTGSACQSNPSLTVKVAFDDYLPGNSNLLTSTCVATCGESATTRQWTWGATAGSNPSPSTTTTVSGVTTVPTSSTTTSTTTTSTTTTSTTTTSTTTTSTTTTSTTTTTIAAGKNLVILSQPQTFVTSNSSGGSTSGSIVVQSQNSAGVPIVQSSNLTVTLNYSTNGQLSSPYGPSSLTIPAGSSFGTAVFRVGSNGSSSAQNFTVSASNAAYASSLGQTETVEPDAIFHTTTFGAISPRSISSSGATATFTVPVHNTYSGGPHYLEVTSVGGLLTGESASGTGFAKCLKVDAGSTSNAQVKIKTTSTRFASTITPTTVNFLVTRYSDRRCTTVNSPNFYQGNATLTVG